MNSINQITSGLASSLFLAAGLTRLAEKTDPLLKRDQRALTAMRTVESCRYSEYPCSFAPQTGQ